MQYIDKLRSQIFSRLIVPNKLSDATNLLRPSEATIGIIFSSSDKFTEQLC